MLLYSVNCSQNQSMSNVSEEIYHLFIFSSITPTLCPIVNEYPWLDRCSSDARRHKWRVCIHCPLKNQLISTLIFITLIFFSTPRTTAADHIWNCFELYKRVFLRRVKVSFSFVMLSEYVGNCTCQTLILFHIILSSSLLSSQ
jgi:hypothetical protein